MAASGPYRVLGGAGTGKTVVAMHRAKHLVETVFPGRNDRILFTTFTRNLATVIHENLKTLCGPDLLSRIEVVNFDAWVSSLPKGRGSRFEPVFDGENDELWENALALAPPETGLSGELSRQEWDEVIQPQGIDTLAKHLRAPRLGRGTKIGRATREAAILSKHVKQLLATGVATESICIVGRTKTVIEHVKDALRAADLALYEIKREATDNRNRPGVRVATMHRVKGLEFDHILVASANDKVIPLEKAVNVGNDPVARRNAETAERALLYVALTRAKKSAVVSGWGAMTGFVG